MIVHDDRYEVFDDPYCYRGTQVLKNKAKLRDPDLLRDFELEMTVLRSREALPEGDLDPVHYCALHHHLFQDVYGWAGNYREVRMSKGSNAFCFPEFIKTETRKHFDKLVQPEFNAGASRPAFVQAASDFLADLNAIHCFRDGNGRTQLTFMHLLARRAGHALHLERVRRETFLPAMIASFSGDLAPLRRELTRLCSQTKGR
jgi:cell filamentation protein